MLLHVRTLSLCIIQCPSKEHSADFKLLPPQSKLSLQTHPPLLQPHSTPPARPCSPVPTQPNLVSSAVLLELGEKFFPEEKKRSKLKGCYLLAHRLVRRFEMQTVQNRSSGLFSQVYSLFQRRGILYTKWVRGLWKPFVFNFQKLNYSSGKTSTKGYMQSIDKKNLKKRKKKRFW